MGLRDRLTEEKTQLEQQKQSEDEERFGAIRGKISDLSVSKQELEAQLAELNEGYTKMGTLHRAARTLRKPVSEVFAQFKEVLAAKGIHSVGDLLKSPEYEQEAEVQAFHAQEGRTKEHFGTLKEKKKTIKADSQPEKPNITKKEAEQKIREQIAAIERESQELFDQTPEGQQARRDEIKTEIAQAHQVNYMELPEYGEAKIR